MAQWNAKLLMTSPMPQYNIVGTGEPRATLADFDGMRVRATGGIGQAFKSVGAVPTSVTATEAYQARNLELLTQSHLHSTRICPLARSTKLTGGQPI